GQTSGPSTEKPGGRWRRVSPNCRPDYRTGRSASPLRANQHAWAGLIGGDVRVPDRLAGVVAAGARAGIVGAGSVIGRSVGRGDGRADDGAGEEAAGYAGAHRAAEAAGLGRARGGKRRGADRSGRGEGN